ncbi:MAG: hypothetical protein K2J36_05560 [Ruminococcus sp.]|nr:hypothetical protein [Ruminococcus sp.]
MNKKSKKTLKNAFNIPEPKRKEEFLNSLPAKQKKSFSFNVSLYISTAITAVVIIGIWGGIKNLPHFDPPINIDTHVYTETTSLPEHTENTFVQTTTTTSTEKHKTETATVTTSGKSTVSGTQPAETTSSGAGTVITETETFQTETTITTTKKESNNISNKPTTEIHTNEITSSPETDFPETTLKITASQTVTETTVKTTVKTTTKTTTATRTTTKTNLRTTTKTTTMPHTTTTKTFYTNISPMTTTTAESEVNYVTTTTLIDNEPLVDITTSQTLVATMDSPPVPATTTTPAPPTDIPPVDLTVTPKVQYYPDGEIYIMDSESNDSMPPTEPDVTGIFRQMIAESDLIAIVEVDEIIYTGFEGVPYTQENVIVKDVIYGDIQTNSRISVYCKGGYIPAEEYFMNVYKENVTVLDYAGNRKFSEVGDVYMCFLKEKDGIYYLTGLNDISKFECHEDYFVNFHNNQYITLNDIQNFINN